VLHWFTGTAAEARRAVDLGCYFSINAEMLANEKRGALVKALPLNRLLTETDGPFTQTDNRPSRPSDVGRALDGLAAPVRSGSREDRRRRARQPESFAVRSRINRFHSDVPVVIPIDDNMRGMICLSCDQSADTTMTAICLLRTFRNGSL
jgi:hypothetical protein